MCARQARQARRPQGKALEILRALVRERQDIKCALGPEPWTEIDHIDGDIGNNSPSNIRGLCKSHNLQQRNIAKLTRTAEQDSVRVPQSGERREESSLDKNRRCEPAWVEYVTEKLRLVGRMSKSLLEGDSALAIGISVYTIRNRYWDKWASSHGPFIVFRPEGSTVEVVELRSGQPPIGRS